MICSSLPMKRIFFIREVAMNAIFLKVLVFVKAVLAALGMGGCLPLKEEHIMEEIVQDIIDHEDFSNTLPK
jgi:hypothetical protein